MNKDNLLFFSVVIVLVLVAFVSLVNLPATGNATLADEGLELNSSTSFYHLIFLLIAAILVMVWFFQRSVKKFFSKMEKN
ncbi:MAG: hypothetical protein NUV67_04755 [archaeon]|nr:hypothetical protein [archaeon]